MKHMPLQVLVAVSDLTLCIGRRLTGGAQLTGKISASFASLTTLMHL
jgi:hypothetical protein